MTGGLNTIRRVRQVKFHGRHCITAASKGDCDLVNAAIGSRRRAIITAEGHNRRCVTGTRLIHRDSDNRALLDDGHIGFCAGPGRADEVNLRIRIVVSRVGYRDICDDAVCADCGDRLCSDAITGDDHLGIRQRERAVRPVRVGSEVVRNLCLVCGACRQSRGLDAAPKDQSGQHHQRDDNI
jgi:hypothetical protein